MLAQARAGERPATRFPVAGRVRRQLRSQLVIAPATLGLKEFAGVGAP
jgi:hypothetical protein